MSITQRSRNIAIALAALGQLYLGNAFPQSGRTVNFLGEPLEAVVSTNTGKSVRTENGNFNLDAVTGIGDLGSAPAAYALSQNYPNPFNPSTRIRVNTLRKGRLGVYDLLGREIDALEIEPGQHVVGWEPDNVAAGMYVYRFTAPGFVQSGKMTLADGSGSGRGLSLVSSAGALGKEAAAYADVTFSGSGIESLTLRNIPAGAELGDIVLNQDIPIVQGYLQRITNADAFLRNVLRHANLRQNNLAQPEQVRTTNEIDAVDRPKDRAGYVTVLFDTTADALVEVYANSVNNQGSASLLRSMPRDSLLRVNGRNALDVPAGSGSQYYWVKSGESFRGPNIAVAVDNSTPLRADLNGNGTVDVLDIAMIAQIFANRTEYDPAIDLNTDGEISVLDIANIASVFGQNVARNGEVYLTGAVQSSRNAVSGALVQHGSVVDTTDAAGRYLLRSAPGGMSRLSVSHPSYAGSQSGMFAARDTTIDVALTPFGINIIPLAAQTMLEDSSAVLSVAGNFVPQGVAIERYDVSGFTHLDAAVDQSGQVTLRNRTRDFNGTERGLVRAYGGGTSAELPLEVRVTPLSDVRAALMRITGIAGAPEQLSPGTVEAAGRQYATAGMIDLQLPAGTHALRIYGTTDGARDTYVNSIFTLSDGRDFGMDTVRVCALPDTGWHLNAADFKELVEHNANRVTHGGYIRTFPFDVAKYVIARISRELPNNPMTPAEQQFVVDVLRTKMFAATGIHIPIEVKDSTYVIPPSNQRVRGTIMVEKRTAFLAGIGTVDGDGVINDGYAGLHQFFIDERAYDQMMAELGIIYMPAEVIADKFQNASIFHYSSNFPEMQKPDIAIARIVKYAYDVIRAGYGKVHVDKMLGVD